MPVELESRSEDGNESVIDKDGGNLQNEIKQFYRSANTGAGFRRIEVTTDYELRLRHPAGYRARGGAFTELKRYPDDISSGRAVYRHFRAMSPRRQTQAGKSRRLREKFTLSS
jgi:hypothetical protein